MKPKNMTTQEMITQIKYDVETNAKDIPLRYYYDVDCQEPISLNTSKEHFIELHLPKDTKSGESQSIIFYVKNHLKYFYLELNPYSEETELSFTKYPKYLAPQEVGMVRLTFSPEYNRHIDLDTEWGIRVAFPMEIADNMHKRLKRYGR